MQTSRASGRSCSRTGRARAGMRIILTRISAHPLRSAISTGALQRSAVPVDLTNLRALDRAIRVDRNAPRQAPRLSHGVRAAHR